MHLALLGGQEWGRGESAQVFREVARERAVAARVEQLAA